MITVLKVGICDILDTGLQKLFDVLQSRADPGSCSPSAYVMIYDLFNRRDKCRKIECLDEKYCSWLPFNKYAMNIFI